ncbi:MAG: GntR family transcriptional regulator [Peptococcaceae bacterium]|jgi:DNA-binding GntR family transcriptional regulator|nr:GntR family transcriptional regulator [Peptococcaceae bacterium]
MKALEMPGRGEPLSDQPHSLSYQVFTRLEESILSGKIPPGENLNESRLSAELGVSRTPVREALRMLEQKSLVRIVPNKGAVVLGVDHKDLLDIYAIRGYIEGLASRWAAENITEAQAGSLREIVELQEFYALKSYEEQISDLDSRFHEQIFSCCDSRTLRHVLKDLHHMVRRYRQLSLIAVDRTKKSVAEHRLILEAICRGDGEEAERLTVLHIHNAKENLLKLLTGDLNQVGQANQIKRERERYFESEQNFKEQEK